MKMGLVSKSWCKHFFMIFLLLISTFWLGLSAVCADEIRLEAEDFRGRGRLSENKHSSGRGVYGKWKKLHHSVDIKEAGVYYLWVRYSSSWQSWAPTMGMAKARNLRPFAVIINNERILIDRDTGANTGWSVQRIALPKGKIKVELQAVGIDPYVDVLVLTRDYKHIPEPQKHVWAGKVVADGIVGHISVPESQMNLSVPSVSESGGGVDIPFESLAQSLGKTEAKAWHDGINLYLKFICQPDSLPLKNIAGNIRQSDHIEVVLDGNCSLTKLRCLLVASDGEVEFFRITDGEPDHTWTPAWKIATRIKDNAWQTLLTLPLSELLDTLPEQPGRIRAGFRRFHGSNQAYSAWAGMSDPRTNPGACGALLFADITNTEWQQLWLKELNRMAQHWGVEQLSNTTSSVAIWQLEQQVTAAKYQSYTPPEEQLMVFEGVNLLPNPGFEYGKVSNGQIEPYNWHILKKGELALSSDAYQGKSALRIKLSGNECIVSPGNRPYIDSSLDYLWSGWFKCGDTHAVTAALRVVWYLQDMDKPGGWGQIKYGGESKLEFQPSKEWQEFKLHARAPEGAVRCEFELHVAGQGGILYCDDLVFDGMGANPVDFHLPQPGFDTRANKQVVIWSREQPDPEFVLYAGQEKVLTAKLAEYGISRWKGTTFYADLSNVRQPGKYTVAIRVNNQEHHSPEFVIADELYLDHARLTANFFFVQRQGVDVPGWHKANFLDDAVLIDRNTGKIVGHRDLAGGWQDAGDPSKQACSDMSIYGLAEFYENTRLQEYSLKEKYPDILSLAWVEVDRQINKCYDGGGRFYSFAVNNMSNASWIKNVDTGNFRTKPIHKLDPAEWTDNLPNTPDDRFAVSPPSLQWITSGLAKFARCIRSYDKPVAEQIIRIMREDYVLRQARQAEWSKDPLTRVARGDGELCKTALHLYALSGEQKFKDDANAYATEIIRTFDLQLYTTNTGHILSSDHYKWSYYNLAIALLEHARDLPQSSLVPDIKRVLDHFVAHNVIERSKDNEFGVVTYLTPGPGLRLIHPNRESNPYVGANMGVCYLGYLTARVGRLLQKPEYFQVADRAAQWVIGRNPKGTSMLIGNGWKFAATSTSLRLCQGHEDGVIPGAVIRGMASRSDTPPDFPALNIASNPGGRVNSNMHEVYQADTIALLLICQELHAARYLDPEKY